MINVGLLLQRDRDGFTDQLIDILQGSYVLMFKCFNGLYLAPKMERLHDS